MREQIIKDILEIATSEELSTFICHSVATTPDNVFVSNPEESRIGFLQNWNNEKSLQNKEIISDSSLLAIYKYLLVTVTGYSMMKAIAEG